MDANQLAIRRALEAVGRSSPCRRSAAAAPWSISPIAMSSARSWKAGMLVVDTNMLAYAADADSQFHVPCRDWLERQRARQCLVYATWGILYEFLRSRASAGHAAAVERQSSVAIRDGATRFAGLRRCCPDPPSCRRDQRTH